MPVDGVEWCVWAVPVVRFGARGRPEEDVVLESVPEAVRARARVAARSGVGEAEGWLPVLASWVHCSAARL